MASVNTVTNTNSNLYPTLNKTRKPSFGGAFGMDKTDFDNLRVNVLEKQMSKLILDERNRKEKVGRFNYSDISQLDSIDKVYNIRAKLISDITNEDLIVGDNTGHIRIRFSEVLKDLTKDMKSDSVYDIFNGKYLIDENDKKPYLFMGKGSFLTLSKITLPDVEIIKSESLFTTKELFNIHQSNVEVKEPLMLKLSNVYNTQISENGKQVKYRRAMFKDEFNVVSLTVFGTNCNEMDKWNIGSIYKITNFKTNYYINIYGQKSTNMVWWNNKTKIDLVSDLKGGERYKHLLLLNTLKGRIFSFYNMFAYKSCWKCGRSVNNIIGFENLQYDSNTEQTISKNPNCKCGSILSSNIDDYEDNFTVVMVIEDDKDDEFRMIQCFKKDLCKNYKPEMMPNEKYLEYLKKKDVFITFYEKKDSKGIVREYLQKFNLIIDDDERQRLANYGYFNDFRRKDIFVPNSEDESDDEIIKKRGRDEEEEDVDEKLTSKRIKGEDKNPTMLFDKRGIKRSLFDKSTVTTKKAKKNENGTTKSESVCARGCSEKRECGFC